MLESRRRRLVAFGGLALLVVLAVGFGVSVLDDDAPERQRTTLQELSDADLDGIVVQLQDRKIDGLSPTVVDDYRDAVVLAGEDPPGSREPLVALRSDDDDESIWDRELIIVGFGVALLAALFLTWRALRLRRERRS
jgi:hypothetical protein